MKTLRALITLTAGALLVAGCSINPTGVETGGGGAVDPSNAPAPATEVEAQGLRLTSMAEKNSYVVGEPVYLRVLLKNGGRESRAVQDYLDTQNGALQIRIQGPGKEDRLYKPLAIIDDTGAAKLAPGETLGNVVPVFFGAHGWSFPEPGRYAVTVRYSDINARGRREWVTAEPVTLDIDAARAPLPMGSPAGFQAGKFLLWQSGDHLDKGRELLMGHARQHPDALISDYINAAFARSLSDHFMDYRREQVRPADCDKAMAFLERVDETRVGDYIRVQNAITGLRCAARGQDARRVERYRDLVQQLTEGKPAYRPLAQRAAELAGGRP